MKMSNFIDGLTILRAYFEGQDGYHIEAQHDRFYVYATSRPMSGGDIEKLVKLGWFQPEAKTKGCDEFSAKHYDPAGSWAAYT